MRAASATLRGRPTGTTRSNASYPASPSSRTLPGGSATRTLYRRRAPTQREAYQESWMLEIFTTSPVCGEWMNRPPPT
jgi:hypothetical protein